MQILKKVIKVFINTLMTLIIIIGIAFIGLYIAGFQPFVVESGSMEPVIETKSLCFINKNAKFESIQVGDIVAYKAATKNKVVHRALNITNEGIETKGDANEISDGVSVTSQNLIGKYVFSIPKLGYVVKLIQTTRGKIIFGTAIVVLFLAGVLLGDGKKSKHAVEDEVKDV